MIWTGGALDGEAVLITGYAVTNGVVTYSAGLSEAIVSSASDPFKIV